MRKDAIKITGQVSYHFIQKITGTNNDFFHIFLLLEYLPQLLQSNDCNYRICAYIAQSVIFTRVYFVLTTESIKSCPISPAISPYTD
jgi:hypothetical protein